MGLIKSILNAGSTVLADQWLEYFYCDSLSTDVLVAKGQKRTTSGTSNTKGSDNIISNGSTIAVADGQCMIIVEQGKVVEVAAEAGEYKFDSSTEPSIFAGNLGKSILDSFKAVGRRFTYGGDTGKDQRVYYFNTKEIMDNKFGTTEAIPFSVKAPEIFLNLQTALKINGRYTYKITNPLLFYTNVCGNVEDKYLRSQIDAQLKNEFINALAPAVAQLSLLGILPSDIPIHQKEVTKNINAELDEQWASLRGIEVVSIAFNPITIPAKDNELIQNAQMEAQRISYLSDPTRAGARLVDAQASAMEKAAENPNGAMMGFMGMGMAQQAGGMNAQNFFQMGQQQAAQPAPAQGGANAWQCSCGASNTGKFCSECAKPKPAPAGGWQCACGATNTGKFCMECGKPKPADNPTGWTCSCGAVNGGKFCMECGKAKPSGEPLYRCDKCGWEPEDPKNPPKFCPECADPFTDDDITG
ncbi:MAG: SPFH domain-containing protein [Ruminiclostridium sp.]|nr:SPFH domain-containing protein [Ruminiclostridium sp.]